MACLNFKMTLGFFNTSHRKFAIKSRNFFSKSFLSGSNNYRKSKELKTFSYLNVFGFAYF